MLLSHKLGYDVSYGAIVAAMLGYSVSMVIALFILNKKYKFNFSDTIKRLPSYIISTIIFILSIVLMKLFIPVNLNGRFIQIPILMIYGVVSFGIYIALNYFNGNLRNLFGKGRKKNENRNRK